jgi:hypothetical protein
MHTKVSESTSILSVVLGVAVLVLSNFITVGQSSNQNVRDPLSPIPVKLRPKLKERLNLLINYQGARQWSKMYDLLTASIKGGRNRDDYANWRRQSEIIPPISTLLAFAPTEAITIDQSPDGGAWFILGCAQYRRRGRMVQIKSGVTAELQNNEWWFSEVGTATQIDGTEEPCVARRKATARVTTCDTSLAAMIGK